MGRREQSGRTEELWVPVPVAVIVWDVTDG